MPVLPQKQITPDLADGIDYEAARPSRIPYFCLALKSQIPIMGAHF